MKIWFLLTFFIAHSAFACGEYDVHALVLMKEGLFALVINPGSRSEINLKVENNESLKLSPYMNRLVEAKILIAKKMTNTQGVADSIQNIKVLVPDPLAPGTGTRLLLLKEKNCRK